ncbi:hypothetical protein Bpfe_014242 [Biomphalaria pfeifferi]|uniref:Uncharacterized protein n=1 Tax=Biomphalaria pfeifferi TaxID=112525 RepID=A0AAD8F9A6_BIOPF|nr:hypothetical protein Bpfe_014242 [Biomphalaria pfeifferi]
MNTPTGSIKLNKEIKQKLNNKRRHSLRVEPTTCSRQSVLGCRGKTRQGSAHSRASLAVGSRNVSFTSLVRDKSGHVPAHGTRRSRIQIVGKLHPL